MRNLFEELDRIKNLMVYEKGTSITEVSASAEPEGGTTTKTSTEKPSETKGEESKTKEEPATTDKVEGKKGEPVLVDKNECFDIKATGRFKVNVPRGSNAVNSFITEIRNVINSNPEYKVAMDSGTMYIREITLQGFASNHYGGPVEPEFANDYCKKWSVLPDSEQGGVCTDFEFKKFSGKKLAKYTGNQGTNQKLAKNRAVNLFNIIKDTLNTEGKKYGIKMDPTTVPTYKDGGSLYTKDNVDENWKTLISSGKATDTNGDGKVDGRLNPGQIVAVTAKICYTLKEPCPDPCMTKGESGKCMCPDGMTYNEQTKQCECPPDQIKEGCECVTKQKIKCPDCMSRLVETAECECPDNTYKIGDKCFCDKDGKKAVDEKCGCPCPKCMEKDKEGNCNCKEGKFKINDKCYCDEKGLIPVLENCDCPKCGECTKYNLDKKECECEAPLVKNEQGECVCPKETPIRVSGTCKCIEEKKQPLKCNYNAETKGGRGVKANNFIAASVESSFPVGDVGVGDKITITFDSLVVPDAFYVKYGDQEFFSGFMGDVWNAEYKQVALSADERKKMLYIQPKSMIHFINTMKDDDLSSTENTSRNFVGELMYYKDKEGLLESINGAIGSVGGQLKVDSIFKGGDGQAKKVTDEIKNIDIDITKSSENRKAYSDKLRAVRDGYGPIMKKNVSFTIEREQKDFPVTILVFSPLDRTIFNMKVECK
jgi:hypothetical protein